MLTQNNSVNTGEMTSSPYREITRCNRIVLKQGEGLNTHVIQARVEDYLWVDKEGFDPIKNKK